MINTPPQHIAPRDYQVEAMESLHDGLQRADILLLQAATGAGKTFIIVRMIAAYCKRHPGRTFLILMHKKELVEQFVKAFQRFTDLRPGVDIGIACAGVSITVDIDKRVTIASVQTLINRLNEYPGADLVVVDETHRIGHDQSSQYRVLLDTLRNYRPEHKVIGVTATAYRLGHGMIYGDRCRPGRQNFFPELTHRITYKRLVEEGHLMRLKGFVAVSQGALTDLSDCRISQGEYNMGDAGRIMARHVRSAVEAYEQYGGHHPHVAVFACTIDHAKALAAAFTDAGHSACVIHSQLSDIERTANISDWQAGAVKVAVAINILVEGFDFPELSCLVMCRPTKSPVVFIQAIGRILRMAPGKDEALLIDLTGNCQEFGMDLDTPQFTIPAGAEGEGEAPIKVCPGRFPDDSVCAANLHPAVLVCQYCGYEYPVEEVEPPLGTMREVDFNEPEDPAEWYLVTDMTVFIHTAKKTGKALIKVALMMGYYQETAVWICLPDYYSGFAVEKGREKWAEFSNEPFPETVEEAMFLVDSFRLPSRVLCKKDGRFLQAMELDFSAPDVPVGPKNYLDTMEISADEVPF